MKRILSTALAALIAVLMLSMPAALATGKNITYEKRDVTAYLYNADTKETFECLFRPDMDLPYISATDYLNQVYTAEFTSAENGDGTYTVSNKNGSFVVDPEKNTVHFDEYEKVVLYDSKPILETEKSEYLKDDNCVMDDGKVNGLDLDLGKYDIDITSSGGSVYFPLTTIADIFATTYQNAVYLDGNIYFNSVMDSELYYNDDSFYASVDRDEDLIDYTYNELCFAVDNFYGRPPKAEISESIESKGLDKSLDEYSELSAEAKKLLKSKDKIDFYFGLLYLDSLFFDGGHTSFSGAFSTAAEAKSETVLGKAMEEATSDISDERMAKMIGPAIKTSAREEYLLQIMTAREKGFGGCEKVKEWGKGICLIQKDKTVVFEFNDFADAVVEPFKWSLDYAQENGVENFVVDLSTNGGGTSSVAMYMLSVMTGNGDLTMKETSTDNRLTETAAVDKNLDGKFDEKDDEVNYDLEFAVLTSCCSFSSANFMPYLAQERGVKILGETSGGGTCMLAVEFFPEPISYSMSGDLMMVNKDGNDIDGGVKPDVELVTITDDGEKDYSGMFSIDNINSAIDSEEVSLNGRTESEMNEDNAGGASSGSVMPLIWAIVGVCAAAAFAAVLLLTHRKGK